MTWEEILSYKRIIVGIATKYSCDNALRDDVVQEVMLRLYRDENLDTSKFDPNKRGAAIRNTIRNKVLKVLKSKKIGRWPFDSLDMLVEGGFQVDSKGRVNYPRNYELGSPADRSEGEEK